MWDTLFSLFEKWWGVLLTFLAGILGWDLIMRLGSGVLNWWATRKLKESVADIADKQDTQSSKIQVSANDIVHLKIAMVQVINRLNEHIEEMQPIKDFVDLVRQANHQQQKKKKKKQPR